MSEPRAIILQWQPSSFFGWGVYGLNLLLHWAEDSDLAPLCSAPISLDRLALDPARLDRLKPVLARSVGFQARLEAHGGQAIDVTAPVLTALGGDFSPSLSVHDVLLRGRPDIATVFFESEIIDAAMREQLWPYRLIVAGSNWNRQLLDAHGIGPAATVLQGIDDTLFHPPPVPVPTRFPGRFVIFSGGKLEYRKGQDLVLLAFRAFAARHPEALLVTAWHCPWPDMAASMAASPGVTAVPVTVDGTIDVAAWAAANGLAEGSVLDLGPVPNAGMPELLWQADLGLFPNRAEGGTNLVAMEAMACGVPVILSANTGHLDLIAPGACLALSRQAPVPGRPGWGESDVDEIVAALETLWRDRSLAGAIGREGARRAAGLSWRAQTAALKRVILPFL